MVDHGKLPAAAGGEHALEGGSILFVGTATVLIRYGGFTILTDPNFLHRGERVHLGYGLRSTRRTDPALELEDLPPLDLVLLSHLHEDHFDRRVARDLDRRTPLVTTGHAAVALRRQGFEVIQALRTWEALEVEKEGVRLRITGMPGRHGPALLSWLLPPVMGSLLEFFAGTGEVVLRLYISGDTLVHEALYEIPRRFPEIDLALLHLGGTRILGVLVTMDDEQGVRALQILDPHEAIPIHYDDYTVFKSPLDAFKRAVEGAGLEERIRYLNRGEAYSFEIPRTRLQVRPAPVWREARP